MKKTLEDIPVEAAKEIAEKYGLDQVIILARGGGEFVTTYGVDRQNCMVAACIGDLLKYDVMMWPRPAGVPDRQGRADLLDRELAIIDKDPAASRGNK
jgi:hypothetical protein